MRYEISGGTFPVVTCGLANGEQMITEGGSMVWMTPNMQMETRAGGIGGMFSKAFSVRTCSRTSTPPVEKAPSRSARAFPARSSP